MTFIPEPLARAKGRDALRMVIQGKADWKPGQTITCRVRFISGRTRALKTTIGNPRPIVSLIRKSVAIPTAKPPLAIMLADVDQLPHDARLRFSLRIGADASFTADDAVEVAIATGGGSTTLNLASGLTLQDSQVAVAMIDLAEAFGPSVFGPLRFRAVHDGIRSDWQSLGTLVRLPKLRQLDCAKARATSELIGSDMFLIASLSATADFDTSVEVPEGYPGERLTVPHPVGNQLFTKLRDNPEAIGRIVR